MTMKPGLARALRRFVGTMVMLVGGQAGIYRLLYPPPAFPQASADRVVVEANGSVHEIRDPAAVRRLVAFIRAPKEHGGLRMPHYMHLPNDAGSAVFYRGEQAQVRIVWVTRLIVLPAARNRDVWYFLSPREGAELQRLMGGNTR
ncbi:MAG: hypothetical protein KY467_13800 [Gemmatimonadetes bacterium]|nr:hypothetical protein [Gemmatimonadota bacterium]